MSITETGKEGDMMLKKDFMLSRPHRDVEFQDVKQKPETTRDCYRVGNSYTIFRAPGMLLRCHMRTLWTISTFFIHGLVYLVYNTPLGLTK